jgi:hypothetical protein
LGGKLDGGVARGALKIEQDESYLKCFLNLNVDVERLLRTPSPPPLACLNTHLRNHLLIVCIIGVDPVIVDDKGVELQGECEGLLMLRRPWPSILRRCVYGCNLCAVLLMHGTSKGKCRRHNERLPARCRHGKAVHDKPGLCNGHAAWPRMSVALVCSKACLVIATEIETR